jgi:hypothetical protein
MQPFEMFIPLGLFFMITVSVALLTRLIATAMLNRTIREGLRGNSPHVPQLIDKLEARQPWADALLGWISLAFAAALIGLGLFDDPEDRTEYFRAAVIPIVIGLTVLAYVQLVRPRTPAA